MITQIEVKNFRALRQVNVSLKPLQVLVGPNASGKSTFFDVIALVRDLLWADLVSAISGNARVGIAARAVDPRELTWNKQGGPLEIALTLRIPETLSASSAYRSARYEIALELENQPRISAEYLWLIEANSQTERTVVRDQFPEDLQASEIIHRGATPSTWRNVMAKEANGSSVFRSERSKSSNRFKLGPQRSTLANLLEDTDRFPVATWLKRYLMEGTQILALDPLKMRLPARASVPREFMADGSNLPWVAWDLEEHAPQRMADWTEHLRASIPDLQAITTRERPEDRSRYLEVTYTTGLVAPSWLLSDGTLRLMALTLLAYARACAPILLIEEPENGIHPQALETVWQSLSSIYDGQVFCATHSPIILSLIEDEQLLCFARTPGGAVDIVNGTQHPALKSWRAEVQLGDLLAMGILG